MVFPEGGDYLMSVSASEFQNSRRDVFETKGKYLFSQNGGWSLVCTCFTKENDLGVFDPRSTPPKHKKLGFAGLSIYKKDKSELQCQTLKSRLSYDMKIKSQGRRLTAAAADGPVVLEWHLTSAEGGKCQVFSVRQRTHCAFR